jgi:aromatic ring-cleaving dioxygenase
MPDNVADPAGITGYHAHIYYAPETRAQAAQLRGAIGEKFGWTQIGRMHDVPVGPHPGAMYQVAFEAAEFPRLVPWLMLNREGLDVLVHPQTGDPYADHAVHALWLGAPQNLRLDGLRRGPATS